MDWTSGGFQGEPDDRPSRDSKTGADVSFSPSGKAWGGRFEMATDRRVELFTESISFDHRLYRQDIRGSIAHVEMLARVGLVTDDERGRIVTALEEIEQEIAQGRFPFSIEKEDIHMHIESALIAKLGDAGRKIHTARSRNDQVATDFKMWVRDALDRVEAGILTLQRAMILKGWHWRDAVMPGYTHLQRAQPVIAAHALLAYVEKLERDQGRLRDARKRLNECPLGAAALAGTSLPIDRRGVAEALGFDRITANSLDAASDRDFALEAVFGLATLSLHLSGWAEEWVLWSGGEFGFLKLPDALCTGSSIMPQKKNPDVLELIRGKSARVVGALTTLMVLVKGLPLAYNRDLQEDKQPVFDAFDTVESILAVAAPLVEGAELNRERILRDLEDGFLDATTLMEHLIARGAPQRSAHETVGRLVAECERRGLRRLSDLDPALFAQIDPRLDAETPKLLGVAQAVKAFRSEGSTAPDLVETQLRRWADRLQLTLE
ncbi:argininosuccinate lyase [Isosphaera pallida ATCC 43644]|uniref:Argininosuccinate lyase n=1 Tax=Isosphaera pallida (strain ATCC 43644 / DSM 9630 / IS1B) TaxID=575540 RepID=E8R4Y2_ISOPI|nr:argininosuccinate lyase [Isosphaera pallida]ADV61728.1 argininosuccinate lyase [Isosphaera pallida ATCC 43644]